MKKLLLYPALFWVCSLGLTAQTLQVPTTQYSIITKKTATWCPICGGVSWTTFRQMINDNQSNAILIAAHYDTGSKLYSKTAQDIVANFEGGFSYGQPVFFFNSQRLTGRDANTAAMARDMARTAHESTPSVQTAINAVLQASTNTLLIETRTTFFSSGNGNYRLAIYPILKSVVEEQASRGRDTHKMILLDEISGNSFGQVIASGTAPSGRNVEGRFETGNSKIVDAAKEDNLQLAAVIWKENGSRFDFVNAYVISTIRLEVVSSNNNVNIPNLSWNIPSFQGYAELQLNASTNIPNAQIEVFDLLGKKINTIYNGQLLEGQHTFRMDAQAGVKLVSIRVGNQIATTRFLVY
jgi:hypothetical protein